MSLLGHNTRIAIVPTICKSAENIRSVKANMQLASPNRPLTIVDIVLKQKSDPMTSREEEGVKKCAPIPARNGTCARAPLLGRTINCRLRRHEVVHKGRDWDARSVSRNCLTSRVCETDACHGVQSRCSLWSSAPVWPCRARESLQYAPERRRLALATASVQHSRSRKRGDAITKI